MARNRMIKPEFWEDEKVGEMSFGARLLFIGSLNYADDEGYIRWNPEYINSSIFIYDNLSKNKIKTFMKELENLKIIEVFETKNHFFVAKIKNFKKHQKISHPQATKFDIDFETKNESEVLKNQCEIEKNSVNDSVNDSALKEVKEKLKENKEKEKEKEVKEKTANDSFSLSQKTKTAETTKGKQQTAIPKGFRELVDYLIQKYNCPPSKAKLIANRVQSDKFELSLIQCEELSTMPEDNIIGFFDTMKKVKLLKKSSKMVNMANAFNRS